MIIHNYRLYQDPLIRIRIPPDKNRKNCKKGIILILEKDTVLRDRLQEALVDWGFIVAATSDLHQAQIYATEQKNISLLIADLHMGSERQLNGYDFFLKWIDENPKSRTILTSRVLMFKYLSGYKPGQIEFLLKPFEIDECLQIAQKLIGKSCYRC